MTWTLVCVVTLVGCGTPRHTPTPNRESAAPIQTIVDANAEEIADEDPSVDERSTRGKEELATFGKELEAAYADRRRAGAPDKMRELRARAEKLAGRRAVIGIAGDFVANVPSGLRVVTGTSGATVIDAANVPVGWFDISESKQMCPPCERGDRWIVALPLAAKLVALLPQRMAYDAIVVDLDTMRTVANVAANVTSIAVAPDRKQLAIVDLDYEDGQTCRGALTIVKADGTIQRRPPFSPPPIFCGRQTAGSWRDRKILVSTGWSEEVLTVDLATGTASHAKPRQPHKDDTNRHGSRVLCGPDRQRVKATGCSVASRWVFPADACVGAQLDVDEHAAWVCSPDFQGL